MKGIVDRSALLAAIAGLACAPLGVAAIEALAGLTVGDQARAADRRQAAFPGDCDRVALDTARMSVDRDAYGVRLAAAGRSADAAAAPCADPARRIYVQNDALPADGVRGQLRR